MSQGSANAARQVVADEENRGFLDGLDISSSLLVLGQQRQESAQAGFDGRGNYRLDVEMELPLRGLAESGNHSMIFAHFRAGQGYGLSAGVPTFTGAINSSAFANDDSGEQADHALLAQLWLQIERHVNVSEDGKSHDRMEWTAGKIDPAVFFDTNAVADDESEAFVNNVFVHNPQLDSGGDLGADEFGFTPGLVGSYVWNASSQNRWSAQIGVFGAGEGARFKGPFNRAPNSPFSKPFTIAQVRYEGASWLGETGVYQAYAWNNPQSENAIDGSSQRHSGVGVSIVQGVGKYASAFARAGHQLRGEVAFDSNLTGGVVLGGSYWSRPQDRAGLAVGWLVASDEYRQQFVGTSSHEFNAEMYYNWQVNPVLQLSPHLILIKNPAADPTADHVKVVGLRTRLMF